MTVSFVLVNQDQLPYVADVPLQLGEYIVGRSGQTDIPIVDITISRQHARLCVEADTITITDLGSRNKCFVNRQPVRTATVTCGDEIRFGRVTFQVVKASDYKPGPDRRELDTGIHKSGSPELDLQELRSLLTPAQLRVMTCVLAGHSEKETGQKLGISHHTVHNHIREIYHQMKVQSRAELLSLFISPNLSDGSVPPKKLRMNDKTVDEMPVIDD